MADVAGAGERGQLLLVTALSMAIMFVALALVLNTAIYTENLATRSSDIGGGTDAIRFRESARQGIAGAVEYANTHNNTSHAGLRTNLTESVDDWTNATGKLSSTRSAGTSVALSKAVNGTRIEQDDAARNFTNESGSAANWTLASSVDNTRKFRMEVSRGALAALLANAFEIVVDDGTSTWSMKVTEDGVNDIKIEIDRPGGSGSCTRTASQAWINITDGTFDGTECSALDFPEGLSSPYRIEYNNADEIEGTYRLVVDNSTLATDPDPNFHDDTGSGSPYVTPAIYSADLDVVYRTPRLYYNTTVRVAPGEPA